MSMSDLHWSVDLLLRVRLIIFVKRHADKEYTCILKYVNIA